jgi:Protein of unknown function (DUF3800)
MFLFYIDGSQDGHYYTYSALGVRADKWRVVSADIGLFRKHLRATYGIFVAKELHAWKFVSGRGRPSDRHLSKPQRAAIFEECLLFVNTLANHGCMLFNSALTNQEWAFERLVNRINRTMQAQSDLAMLICDEGNEWEYMKLVRKMGVYNPIPSRYGGWKASGQTKNITIDHIIEDPLFKQSHRSTLIQLVDFCAYALLRQDKPHPAKTALGLDKSFKLLDPICFKQASKADPMGVIR